MVATLIGFILAGFLSVGDACSSCKPTALCPDHLVQENAAVAQLAPLLKSKDPFERSRTLAKLGELDAKHPLCPTADTAKLVAGLLDDESVDVRTEAAKALGNGMHPDVAITALIGALDATKKGLAKIPFGMGDWGAAPGQKEDPKVTERRKAREELNALETTIVAGLVKLPDDRSVAALVELLPQLTRWNGEMLATTTEGILKLGARGGVEAVVARIKTSPVGDTGGRWGGPDTTGHTLRDLLAAAAAAKGTDPVPPWIEDKNAKDQPDWDKWFTKNQKHFPAKLGKYTLAELQKKT